MSSKVSTQALTGLKVLGFVVAAAGTLAIKFLAEHGATAIRVESNTRPDNLRTVPPYKDDKPGLNRSSFFACLNNDKYSISLNLKHPKGREIARKLVVWSDLIIENYSIGTMKDWGLDYEEVRKIKPDAIMVSLSMVGQNGHHKMLRGYGPQLQGMAGLVELTGWPDRPPVLIDSAYPDYIAPRFATVAALAALDYKRKTGKGQYIDISEYENCLQLIAPAFLDYTVNRRVQTRNGNKCSYAAPHAAYRCKGDDAWCVISVFNEVEWGSFCKVLGNPQWTKDQRFVTLLSRKQNEDELNIFIEGWTSQFAPEEVTAKMQSAGVSAGAVRNASDIIENCPQFKHRKFFNHVNHLEIGEYMCVGTPFLLSKTPRKARMGAPCLGQHNEFICKEMLNIPEDEYIEALLNGAFE